MRSIIIIISFIIPFFVNAQFGKVSAGSIIPKNGKACFNMMFSGGFEVGNYIHVGPSVGFYKFKGNKKPVVPMGLEVSAFEKSKEKISHYIVAAIYYPSYSYIGNYSSARVYTTTKLTGVYQFKIGGGIALPISNTTRLIISGGYSPAKFRYSSKTTTAVSGGPSITSNYEESEISKLFFVNVEFAFNTKGKFSR